MAYVSLEGISRFYGKAVAVESLTLAIQQGEFFSLLGPSGCGKTTTLRMLAGFVKPSSGHIVIDGRDITRLPPESRDIGMVFQNYAIFPHLSVFDNIAFGLQMRQCSDAEIRHKVGAVLEQVDLSGLGERFERELSGGQRQRVALARVLVIEPRILLLDEPLSALDKKMREEMKLWIKQIQQAVGITTIYVTHDQGEALTMSDRIAVMKDGAVLQTGSPEQIYESPANRFIAEFIGDSNLLDGTVAAARGDDCDVELEDRGPGLPLATHAGTTTTNTTVVTVNRPSAGQALARGDKVAVMIRPEAIRLSGGQSSQIHRDSNHDEPKLRGTIVSEIYHGAMVRYVVRTEAGDCTLTVEVPNRPDMRQLNSGDTVGLHWDHASASVIQ